MDSVQSGESRQGTEVAMATPGNKDKRNQDTNTQGPRPSRPRRPHCKDRTRALVRPVNQSRTARGQEQPL